MIIEERYNKLGFPRAAMALLCEDLAIAKKKKDEILQKKLESSARNLANMIVPLPGKMKKAYYRSYSKAFRKKVNRCDESKYAYVDIEVFVKIALDYAIPYQIEEGFDMFFGHFYQVSACVFESLDSQVLFFRGLNQPSRWIISYHLKGGLKPFLFGEPFTGSISDMYLDSRGNDLLVWGE